MTVAVLDSGYDRDHPDLAGPADSTRRASARTSPGRFCPNGTTRQTGAGAAEDDAGHGTHVTGIVTSNGTVSSVGVAPQSSVVAIKVTDNCSFAGCFYTFSEITAGLDHLTAHPELGVDIVNMSLGTSALFTGDCDSATSWLMAGSTAIANLRAAGVLTFASAGNNGSTTQMTAPACLRNVIATRRDHAQRHGRVVQQHRRHHGPPGPWRQRRLRRHRWRHRHRIGHEHGEPRGRRVRGAAEAADVGLGQRDRGGPGIDRRRRATRCG